MSDEWCAHGPSRNCKYCEIERLECSLAMSRKKHELAIEVNKSLQARVEALEGARSNWYCEMCGCSKCMEAEAATEKEVSDGD